MGSRWKSGAVPATVSGEPLPCKGEISAATREPGDLPSPSSAPGRDQPAVRGAASALRLARFLRGDMRCVVSGGSDMSLSLLLSAGGRPGRSAEIIVTGSREPVEPSDSAGLGDRARRGRDRGALALPRSRRPAAADRRACRSRPPARAAPRPSSASAAPRPTTPCSSSTASASTIPPPATRRGSSCSPPTCSRGSRSCAGRNRRSGAREALGGVVAVETADPFRGTRLRGAAANMAASTAPASPAAMRCGPATSASAAGRLAAQRRHRLVRRRRRARRLRQSRGEPEGRGAPVRPAPARRRRPLCRGRQRI